MTREIWFGPVLNGNRDRLIEKCVSRLSSGRADSFLYLAASRPLLDRAVASMLDGVPSAGTWGNLSVYLFRGFVRRILSKAQLVADQRPLAPRIRIDIDEFPIRHTLVSLLLQELADAGQLTSIAPLVRRDGCASTVERLLGEFQRAAISSSEFQDIVNLRANEQTLSHDKGVNENDSPIQSQVDFDRDLAAVYKLYTERLEAFSLTEDDADQLRALEILRGDLSGNEVEVPWLSTVDLLIVDGFYDFTPIQGAILRQIIPRIPNIIVNLNADASNPEIFRPFDETVEMFQAISKFEVLVSPTPALVGNALQCLRTRLFNPDIEIPIEASTDENNGEPAEPQFAEGVRVLNCSDPTVEIRAIAKEIKRLVVSGDYSLSEIVVVFRQHEEYIDLVTRIFDEEGIPCNLGKSLNASEIAPVRAAMKLFDLFAELVAESADQIRMSSLSSVIKSGYFRFGGKVTKTLDHATESEHETEIKLLHYVEVSPDELENAIAFVGQDLTAKEWLSRARKLMKNRKKNPPVLPDNENLSAQEEDADSFDVAVDNESQIPKTKPSPEVEFDILELSFSEIARLVEILNGIASPGTPEELKERVFRAFEEFQYTPLNDSKLKAHTSETEDSVSIIEFRAVEALRLAIDSAVRSFTIGFGTVEPESVGTVSLGDFLKSVLGCLRGINIETSPAGRRGVPVLAATDVRGLRFRAMFIAGLVEGGFPIRPRHDWIYPHEERERLKKFGLTLEDTSPNSLLKEEHYFYQAACRTTELLYLTRPMVSADGSETVESYYVNELRHALLPQVIETLTLRADTDARNLFQSSTQAELALAVSRKQEELRDQNDRSIDFSDGLIERVADWVQVQGFQSPDAVRRIAVARQRAAGPFNEFDGRISNPSLMKLLRERFGAEHVFSASEFGLYGKCPFKFFAERILKLKPRGEAAADLAAIDSGLMIHEILRRFFEAHRGVRLKATRKEALQSELHKIADTVFDEFESKVPPITPNIWRLEREIRKIVLDNFLADELRMQEKTSIPGMRPSFFELGFGFTGEGVDPSSVKAYVDLERVRSDVDRDQIQIRGKIDRVDVAEDGTIVAYDYKLANGASREDMEQGRELQLGIYLDALERLFFPESTIAGGGYYLVQNARGRRNQGLYRAALSSYTGVGAVQSNLDDDTWYGLRRTMMDRLWEFWDDMRAGRFDVAPTAPGKSCTHCDYRALCRFEPHRIGEKMRMTPTVVTTITNEANGS